MAAKYDWELIKQAYRTGRFSLGQLSARYGPDKGTISKRAKREGWEKDLTDQVRQRTREIVSRTQLPDDFVPVDPDSDQAIVEYAAEENAQVVRHHRRGLAYWRGLAERYGTLVGQQLVRDTLTVQDRHGNLVEVDQSLDYIGKCLSYGTQAVERIVKLERQSYGLDQDDQKDGLKSFAELIAEVAPDDEDED